MPTGTYKDDPDYPGTPAKTPTPVYDPYPGPGSEFDFDQDVAPGYSLLDQVPLSDYQEWTSWSQGNDPFYNLMAGAYGNDFIGVYWQAQINRWDDAKLANTLDIRFPGWRETTSSGRRRGGGGGGGGGASRAENIASAIAEIRNQAGLIGLPMKDTDIAALAVSVVDGNWSGDQLMDYLLQDLTALTLPGTYKATQDQIRGLARSQLINVSDASVNEWAGKILSGEMDPSAVAAIFQQQATAEFGWAAASLAQGMTMRDILMPSRDRIADELEINADTVDFMDPTWRAMVTVSDEKGLPRAATLTEVTRAARKDSRWASTAGAARMLAGTATMLRNVFEGGVSG